SLQESLDREVRVDALVAAGRLGDPSVLADVLPLMDHQEIAMREAATFTLGRSGDKRAVAPLLKALDDRRPSVQALACLGLAQVDDARIGPALVKTLSDARRHDGVRGACAYAIGARRIASGVAALLESIADNRGEAQRLAAWALGQIGDGRALGPLIRAYFARAGRSDDELVWAIGRTSGAGLTPAQLAGLGEFPLRGGKYNLDEAIALIPGPLPKPVANSRLVVDHAEDIARGLSDALAEHRRDRRRARGPRRRARAALARRAGPDQRRRPQGRCRARDDRGGDRAAARRAAHQRRPQGPRAGGFGARQDRRRQGPRRGRCGRPGAGRSGRPGARGGDERRRRAR